MSSVYRLLLADPIHEQARNLLASRPGFEVAVACRLTGSKHRDLSAIGALNGWTLLMGQVPMAGTRDDLFPPIFQRLSSRGVPALGIIISAILATLLVSSQVAGPPGFAAFYELVVGLSTMAAVIPYVFCALATGLVAAYVAGGGRLPTRPRGSTCG